MDATTETFERDVVERSRELPVVVDFWAAWCGPCRTLGPAIEGEVAKRTGKLELVKIDIDAETYEVRADGELLTCAPADVLPMAQRYFMY